MTGPSVTPRKHLAIVVPAYNEEGNVALLRDRIAEVLSPLDRYSWSLLFVDDGSRDGTLAALRALAASDPRVRYLSFSRNFGHQAALKAGLDAADGDAVISMDADLQHPPELIPRLIELWEQGSEIVYTVRQDTADVGAFKRATSRLFYRLFNALSGLELDPGAADFRLLDRKVVEAVKRIPESGLFLRGMIHWVGFRQVAVPYQVGTRHSGSSKYTFSKMLRLASDGVLSFSTKPLRLASLAGCFVSGLSGLYALYAVAMHFFNRNTISGWTSLLISVLFLGGIQLLSIGLLGEYLGRVLMESKRRPHYLISERG